MPRKDRKTIDQPKGLVNIYQAIFEENKVQLQLEGISTFQGFMTKLLSGLLLTGSPPENWGRFLIISPDELSKYEDHDQ